VDEGGEEVSEPWKVDPNAPWRIVTSDGRFVDAGWFESWSNGPIREEKPQAIEAAARIVASVNCLAHLSVEEIEANARLIAASPAMLAELQKFANASVGEITYCRSCGYIGAKRHAPICTLAAVIAMATGGTDANS
jgi:hypothetical protein